MEIRTPQAATFLLKSFLGSMGSMPLRGVICQEEEIMTRRMIAIAILTVSTFSANAQSYYGGGSNNNSHYVRPHYNSNGSYTEGHYRTNPNSTSSDNYGTRGNYNPYSGEFGRKKSNGLYD